MKVDGASGNSACPYRYPPPKLPELKEGKIKGKATYVDQKAEIWFIPEDRFDKVDAIDAECLELFANSKFRPQDRTYFEGQACSARFYWDKGWYRGQVLEVDPAGVFNVRLIDYGNIIRLEAAQLRKDVVYPDVPPQAVSFTLTGVTATTQDGRWDPEVVTQIHQNIVDKIIEVNPKDGGLSEMPFAASVSLNGGDFAEFLVCLRMANKKSEEEKAAARKTRSAEDELNDELKKLNPGLVAFKDRLLKIVEEEEIEE